VSVEWGGSEVASLSFIIEKKLGVRYLKMPPYTRTLGPLLSLPATQHSQRMSQAYRVTRELLAKLPAHDVFRQIFDPRDETAFAFSLCGFDVSAFYTFRIPAGSDPDAIWKSLDGRRRKLIAERGKNLRVEAHEDLDRFAKIAGQEFSDSINTYDYGVMQRIFRAAADRGRATILAAVNEQGRGVVNAVTVWGADTAYFWLATRDHEGAGRGAKSFIAWHAVKSALEKGLAFDFDSYGSLSGARFVSTFGVPPVVRPVVMSRRPLVGLAAAFKAAVGPYARYFSRDSAAPERA
jgi:GNAT acetyltransferase-like protein